MRKMGEYTSCLNEVIENMPTVTLYALTTCPWCNRAKKFFRDNNVPYECVDYDYADEETKAKVRAQMDAENATGFPFAIIGDKIVKGYRPELYREFLELE